MLDIKTLETWLWDTACSIRGAVDAPKFKDYIDVVLLDHIIIGGKWIFQF